MSDPHDPKPLAALAAAAEVERAAEGGLVAAAAATDAAIEAARAAGEPWAAVAAAAGIEVRTAQWRLERLRRGPADLLSQQRPSRAGVAQPGDTTSPPPGTITVVEAAELLGYASRQSVLDLVDRGELLAVTVERPGREPRRRIVLDSLLRHPRYVDPRDRDDRSVTVTAAARLLGVARLTVTRMLERGELTAAPTRTGGAGVSSASLRTALERRERAEGETIPVSSAAERLGFSRDKVSRLIERGVLAGEGSPPRVSLASLAAYEDELARAAAGELLSVPAAAEALGVSAATVYGAVRRGDLKRDPAGLISREDIEVYRARRNQKIRQ